MVLRTVAAVQRPRSWRGDHVSGSTPRPGRGSAFRSRLIREDGGVPRPRHSGASGSESFQALPAPSGSRRGSGWFIEFSVVLIALAPYFTLAFPFGLGMRVQAGLIVLLVVVLFAVGRNHLRPWLTDLSPAGRWTLAAWVVSAAWGAVVGWCASNPSRYVVGQLVAMLLFPAGALAFGAQSRLSGSRLATGLSLAAVGALGIDLLAFAVGVTPAQRQGEPLRLMVANGIGLAGLAPAALLFVTAWWWAGAGSRRGAVGFAASLVLVAGSMSRGAWLVSLAGLAALAAWASRERGWAVMRRGLFGMAVGAGVLVGLAAVSGPGAVVWRLDAGRPKDGGSTVRDPTAATVQGRRALPLPAMDPSRERVLAADLRVRAPAVEVTCLTLGPRDGSGRLTVRGYDGRGEIVVRSDVGLGTGNVWVRTDRVVLLPPEVSSASIAVWTGGNGWYLSEVAVREVKSGPRAWPRAARGRLIGLSRLLGNPTGDANLLYRSNEAAAVMQRWQEASPVGVLLGAGLGATFAFSNASYDGRGDRIFLPTANYIHDLYLFLAFKLGLAGFAALAGLAAFVLWSAAHALQRAGPSDDRWVLAATAVVFGAYLVWGVTSPELIDFRVAPLLGAIFAASQMVRERL